MRIRKLLTRRGMAGFGIAALAAGVLATVPSAANAAANITLDRSSLIFGQVAVGSSQDATVTVTNGGTTAFTIGPPVVQAFPSFDPQFTFVGSTCPPGDFAAGASCTITYRFTPTSDKPAVSPVLIFANYSDTAQFTPPFVNKQLSLSLVGNVTCGGLTPTIAGTDGDDDIVGTSGNDVIVALDGEDSVRADGGKDVVCGGGDSDTLRGGTGNDKLYGDTGADVLKGGKGTDTCIGGPSIDRAKKCEKIGSL
jgi:Ca2+-binding RTX toxin-like protein